MFVEITGENQSFVQMTGGVLKITMLKIHLQDIVKKNNLWNSRSFSLDKNRTSCGFDK